MKSNMRFFRQMGIFIQASRLAKGFTVAQLAASLGWTVGQVRALESGRLELSGSQIRDLERWQDGGVR